MDSRLTHLADQLRAHLDEFNRLLLGVISERLHEATNAETAALLDSLTQCCGHHVGPTIALPEAGVALCPSCWAMDMTSWDRLEACAVCGDPGGPTLVRTRAPEGEVVVLALGACEACMDRWEAQA